MNEFIYKLLIEREDNTIKPTHLPVQHTRDKSRCLERSELKLKFRLASNVKLSHLLFHVSFWNAKEAASWNEV